MATTIAQRIFSAVVSGGKSLVFTIQIRKPRSKPIQKDNAVFHVAAQNRVVGTQSGVGIYPYFLSLGSNKGLLSKFTSSTKSNSNYLYPALECVFENG